MTRYKLIIFDYDGTLANTANAISSMRINTIRYLQLEPPDESYLIKNVSLTLAQILRQLDPLISEDKIQLAYEYSNNFYMNEAFRLVELFPKTKYVLDYAKDSGINLAVISNRPQRFLCSELKEFEIHDYFSFIIGLYLYSKPKPDPFVLSEIQRILPDILDNEILFVGDTEIDLQFAKNAGIDCCWASYGDGNHSQCVALDPKFIINDILETTKIMI